MCCIKRSMWFRQVMSPEREWAVLNRLGRGSMKCKNVQKQEKHSDCAVIKSAPGLAIKWDTGSGGTQCLLGN